MNEEKKVKSKQKYPLLSYALGMLALVLVLLLLSYLAQNRTNNRNAESSGEISVILAAETE